MANVKTQREIEKDKEQKIMETVAWRAGYYRANPQRFVSEVLGIHLKLFQKILPRHVALCYISKFRNITWETSS